MLENSAVLWPCPKTSWWSLLALTYLKHCKAALKQCILWTDQQKSIEIVFDHLHRVVADAAEAVHTPAEGADGTASLFIPDIHRLPAGYERAFPLVMVNASEHRLRDTAGLLQTESLTQL